MQPPPPHRHPFSLHHTAAHPASLVLAILPPPSSFPKEGVHNGPRVEPAQVGVLLPRAHEDHRLARLVGHAQRRPDLCVDGVELGQDNPVHAARGAPWGRKRRQRLVKHAQLVDAVVAHEGLPHEEHAVGLRVAHQLGQRAHQRRVVLHAPRRVDQHRVEPLLPGVLEGGDGHRGRVLGVPLLEERHVQAPGVHPQLLHGPRAERVAGGQQHFAAVLAEVVGHLGQRGALAHAVHAHEGHRERPALRLGRVHFPEEVHGPLRGQHPQHRLSQGGFCRGRWPLKPSR
mmetsp:Transcript_25370/g.40063  ORF Transcript_25370/g.40063 Transcript_25370/m.40063 type:complete len:286 (-) Transcript_25370:61-918(-)